MTKLLSQHFRCTALGIKYLWLYSCSLIACPMLSCVYCTGKASGWFFRHEMSDLLEYSNSNYAGTSGSTKDLVSDELLGHH